MGVDPDMGAGGFGLAPVGGAEEDEDGASEGASDMCGAGIGAEDGVGAVEDGDEGADGELASEVDEASGSVEWEPWAFPDDDEAVLGHGVDEFLVVAPGPELGA